MGLSGVEAAGIALLPREAEAFRRRNNDNALNKKVKNIIYARNTLYWGVLATAIVIVKPDVVAYPRLQTFLLAGVIASVATVLYDETSSLQRIFNARVPANQQL